MELSVITKSFFGVIDQIRISDEEGRNYLDALDIDRVDAGDSLAAQLVVAEPRKFVLCACKISLRGKTVKV